MLRGGGAGRGDIGPQRERWVRGMCKVGPAMATATHTHTHTCAHIHAHTHKCTHSALTCLTHTHSHMRAPTRLHSCSHSRTRTLLHGGDHHPEPRGWQPLRAGSHSSRRGSRRGLGVEPGAAEELGTETSGAEGVRRAANPQHQVALREGAGARSALHPAFLPTSGPESPRLPG